MRSFASHQLNALRAKDEQHLVRHKGPPPSNPFKELRESKGYSLAVLAKKSYISKNALVRAENGAYTNPLPSLMDFWVKQPGIQTTLLDLTIGYEDFQDAQRSRHTLFFGPLSRVDPDLAEHPLRQLRSRRPSYSDPAQSLPVGVDELSRALCLPADTLRFWEKKWRQQQTVPKLFNAVLLYIGYSQWAVTEFNANYEQWRHQQLAKERHERQTG